VQKRQRKLYKSRLQCANFQAAQGRRLKAARLKARVSTLFTDNELAFLSETAPSKGWAGLERLRRWQLIKSHDCQLRNRPNGHCHKVKTYTLSDLGVTYLATAAGLGPTPKRLALAHGWEKGFDAQIHHAEHTRIGNELFLQLLKYARERGYPLRWYSEQEARLYLNLDNAEWSGPFQAIRVGSYSDRQVSEREEENAGEHEESYSYEGSYSNRNEFYRELAKYGTKYERFLPDGRAVLQIGGEEWHVAAEIDLTRANYDKMIAKLDYYYMMMQFYLKKPTLCILIVTHHWNRARNLYWLAWRRATQ
jgi:Replication-relaxation